MKKLKLMLPMLAFVLAIGMSFAFVGSADPEFDYVATTNGAMQVDELNCGEGTSPCRARVNGEGPFQVYDDQNLSIPKKGNGEVINIQL